MWFIFVMFFQQKIEKHVLIHLKVVFFVNNICIKKDCLFLLE